MRLDRNSTSYLALFAGIVLLAGCGATPIDPGQSSEASELAAQAACVTTCSTHIGEGMGTCLAAGTTAEECARSSREGFRTCLANDCQLTPPNPAGPPSDTPVSPEPGTPPSGTPTAPDDPPVIAPPSTPPAPPPPEDPPPVTPPSVGPPSPPPPAPPPPPVCSVDCAAVATQVQQECLDRGGSTQLCDHIAQAAEDGCNRICAEQP